MIPQYSVSIPDYKINRKPDHEKIGKILDDKIKTHFLGQTIAIRALGSCQHKGKSVNDLIKIIKKIGHDRYDPKRDGIKYGNVQKKKIEIFAWKKKITTNFEIMKHIVRDMYIYPSRHNKKPTRIDIIIIYDPKQLKAVVHRYYWRKDLKRDGFVFKDQKNKPKAIKAIIKVK